MKRVVLFSLVFGLVSVVFAQEGGTPGSVWMYVGSTWYDAQASITPARAIAVAPDGEVHFVWTKGSQDLAFRQAFYNCWNTEAGTLLSPEGIRISAGRTGFPSVASGQFGHALAAYHDNGGSQVEIKPAIEFLPCSGAFTLNLDFPEPPVNTYFPKSDVDRLGAFHVAGTLEDNTAISVFHARGIPAYEDGTGYGIDWEHTTTLQSVDYVYNTVNIACSPVSDRVAIAWIVDPPAANDAENILLSYSEDGGWNWNPPISVTGIPAIDTNCVVEGGNWRVCNADTFRPFRDLSMIFDYDDFLHIAFTTRGWYYFDENGDPNSTVNTNGSIWHWSEEGFFSLIAYASSEHDSTRFLGDDNLMCQRPCLALDTLNFGLHDPQLICSFQQFDSLAYSSGGYAIGEYFVSGSYDRGRNWAIPTNVSNTPGEMNDPEGQNPSERDITIAKLAYDNSIHALYLHDYVAGSTGWDQTPAHLCSLVYMRTPIEDIDMSRLQENIPFRADSTGFPTASDQISPLKISFELHPNYPNPFNPSTTIQFDLAKAGDVKLMVFDVLGKEVATLVNGRMGAGARSAQFDGEKFASGVYFARLSVGKLAMTRKMVLLK